MVGCCDDVVVIVTMWCRCDDVVSVALCSVLLVCGVVIFLCCAAAVWYGSFLLLHCVMLRCFVFCCGVLG